MEEQFAFLLLFVPLGQRYQKHSKLTNRLNLVNGRTPDAPDVIWVADLTYIRLKVEFVYLATILDAYSRRCIGWNLSIEFEAAYYQGLGR